MRISDWSSDVSSSDLRQLQAALQRHAEEIRPLLVAEVGTPIWLTRDTLFDVPVARLSHYADLAENYPFDDELEDIDFRGVVSKRRIRYEPMGVRAEGSRVGKECVVPVRARWGPVS